MKTWRIIRKTLSYAVIAFLAVYLLILLIFPNKTVNIMGFRTFHVVTSSMDPKYKKHSIVVVTKTNKEHLKKGDIITFKTRVKEKGQIYEVTVTHYIGEITSIDGQKIYKTQTYKNYHQNGSFDTWVDEENMDIEGITASHIIGKVSFGIPIIGYVVLGIQTLFYQPILLILVVLNITVIVYLIYYLKKTKGEPKDDVGPDHKD